MKSSLNNKTVLELKEICKEKELKGYSKLCKDDLVKIVSKNLKKGGDIPEQIIVCDFRYNNYCNEKKFDINKPELYINKLVKIVDNLKQLDKGITNINNSYKTSLAEKKCKEENPYYLSPGANYKKCLLSGLRVNNICSTSSLKKSEECDVYKIYKDAKTSAEYHRKILSNIKSVVDKSNDKDIFYNALEANGITKDDINKYFIQIQYFI